MHINLEPECEIVKKQMRKNQKDWVQHFNDKCLKMISAPDIYRAANQEQKGIIESLAKDFKARWVVTSSRIIYNKDNLNAVIIHDADSSIVIPKTYNIEVPVFEDNFKRDTKTEKYLQALFDTTDNLDQILKVLKKFDSKRTVWLWTPTQSSRASKQVRAVGLCFGGLGRFDVVGDWFDDDGGLSRGVLVPSAEQTTKKGDPQ